jgi:hypothetical protein
MELKAQVEQREVIVREDADPNNGTLESYCMINNKL